MRHRSITNLVSVSNELLPSEWYRAAYAKLTRLITHVLRNVEHIDGRIINTSDNSIVRDDHAIAHMQAFNTITREFIGSPSMQKKCLVPSSFSSPGERNTVTLDSLTKVCGILGISAPQRKTIRLTVCRQVTQHNIWRGALKQVLTNLKSDMDEFRCSSPSFQMGQQIVSGCIKVLDKSTDLPDSDCPSWMRPAPTKKVENPPACRKWDEVLEMFAELSKCLAQVEGLASHFSKLEAMKEGLYQIKDILIERDIGYNEAQWQDCLIQKKLTKSLGHSSKCLFTLLLYYLCGTVNDIQVEVCGRLSKSDDDRICLPLGKVLTSCDEVRVRNGVKELSRALGLFKFVWETAAVKGTFDLHGHVWCVGAEERTLMYRGNVFCVHEIKL